MSTPLKTPQGLVYFEDTFLSPTLPPDAWIEKVEVGCPRFAVVVHNLLTPDECKDLIWRSEAKSYQSLKGLYRPNYRNNDRVMIQDGEWAKGLAARLEGIVPHKIGGMTYVRRCNPRLRLCRYGPGGVFAPHTDGDFREATGARSLLTVNIYLNDVDEKYGGATTFLSRHFDHRSLKKVTKRLGSVQPRAGSALIFWHDILHQGDMSMAPEKYLCRSDVMYE